MQEGSSCNLHSAFLTASPIPEQASHIYLVTEVRNLNRIPNHTPLLASLLEICTVLHHTLCTIMQTERLLTEERQPERLLMEDNGKVTNKRQHIIVLVISLNTLMYIDGISAPISGFSKPDMDILP